MLMEYSYHASALATGYLANIIFLFPKSCRFSNTNLKIVLWENQTLKMHYYNIYISGSGKNQSMSFCSIGLHQNILLTKNSWPIFTGYEKNSTYATLRQIKKNIEQSIC